MVDFFVLSDASLTDACEERSFLSLARQLSDFTDFLIAFHRPSIDFIEGIEDIAILLDAPCLIVVRWQVTFDKGAMRLNEPCCFD